MAIKNKGLIIGLTAFVIMSAGIMIFLKDKIFPPKPTDDKSKQNTGSGGSSSSTTDNLMGKTATVKFGGTTLRAKQIASSDIVYGAHWGDKFMINKDMGNDWIMAHAYIPDLKKSVDGYLLKTRVDMA